MEGDCFVLADLRSTRNVNLTLHAPCVFFDTHPSLFGLVGGGGSDVLVAQINAKHGLYCTGRC